MHDSDTLAFEIRYPWRAYMCPRNDWEKTYRNSFITIWHRDPERDGTDDSCGWFKRARHGDPATLEKIKNRFAFEWERETGGWFRDGYPAFSPAGVLLNMFAVAVYCHYGDWGQSDRFMRRHLYDILLLAENPVDSMHPWITQKYGPEKKADRIEHCSHVVYGCILRWEQPWWRHPRWHVWHWKIQVHPWQRCLAYFNTWGSK